MPKVKHMLQEVRMHRKRRDRADEDLKRAIVEAGELGYPVRAIADAAGCGSSTVHRLLVRSRT